MHDKKYDRRSVKSFTIKLVDNHEYCVFGLFKSFYNNKKGAGNNLNGCYY